VAETEAPPEEPDPDEAVEAIRVECEKQGLSLPAQIAYVLATVERETGGTFQPITERGSRQYFERYEGRRDLGNHRAGRWLPFPGPGLCPDHRAGQL
jgi:hypothetical protein